MIESVKIVSFSEVRGEKTAVVTFSMAGYGFFCDGIKCEDLINLGRACENHEQGKAHDSGLDLAAEADNILASIGGRK